MVGKGFIQDENDIVCPECARKKMIAEMEAENWDDRPFIYLTRCCGWFKVSPGYWKRKIISEHYLVLFQSGSAILALCFLHANTYHWFESDVNYTKWTFLYET